MTSAEVNMIVLRLLRWLFGYAQLQIDGRFPERVVNLAAKKGFIIWNMENSGEAILVFARRGDIPGLRQTAEKTGNSLHTIKEYGLPQFAQKYRERCGLLVGLALAAGFCFFMSGFVWNITVKVPDTVNEYEIRALLRDCGVYEGMRSSAVNTDAVVDHICSTDDRISWMTINIMGTDAEVCVSPRLPKPEQAGNTARFSNLKSTSDGTVTRVNVYKGTANVSAGDGIRKNQLLVSGLMEYNNGKTVLTDAQALVFARTHRNVSISIPKNAVMPVECSSNIRRDMRIFGLSLPLSLSSPPDGNFTKLVKRSVFTLSGHAIPVIVNEELCRTYKNEPVLPDRQRAESVLKNRLALYEFFMLASADHASVISRRISISENGDCFTLNADYDIEENVCAKTIVETEIE